MDLAKVLNPAEPTRALRNAPTSAKLPIDSTRPQDNQVYYAYPQPQPLPRHVAVFTGKTFKDIIERRLQLTTQHTECDRCGAPVSQPRRWQCQDGSCLQKASAILELKEWKQYCQAPGVPDPLSLEDFDEDEPNYPPIDGEFDESELEADEMALSDPETEAELEMSGLIKATREQRDWIDLPHVKPEWLGWIAGTKRWVEEWQRTGSKPGQDFVPAHACLGNSKRPRILRTPFFAFSDYAKDRGSAAKWNRQLALAVRTERRRAEVKHQTALREKYGGYGGPQPDGKFVPVLITQTDRLLLTFNLTKVYMGKAAYYLCRETARYREEFPEKGEKTRLPLFAIDSRFQGLKEVIRNGKTFREVAMNLDEVRQWNNAALKTFRTMVDRMYPSNDTPDVG